MARCRNNDGGAAGFARSNWAGDAATPAISPDGRQSDYWTVRPDGSGRKQHTRFEDGTLVLSASYSPDGAWIVHATDGVDGNADIFVMRADGTGNRPVTRAKQWDSAPDWGPGGS
jgi:hypothetical protein